MPNRTPLFVANWKMNKTVGESLSFLQLFRQKKRTREADVVLCPPFTSLAPLSQALQKEDRIALGAQNCHWEPSGAITGEVSVLFLKDLNCRYVLVGHSERRRLFHETGDLLAKKVAAVTREGMTPIYCIGETLEERKRGETWKVIERQLSYVLGEVALADMEKIVLAYEPVWAIGTGMTATAAQAEEVHSKIRQWVATEKGKKVAEKIRILYGGSVTPEVIGELMRQADIDGGLVGGASLKVDSFFQIINYA